MLAVARATAALCAQIGALWAAPSGTPDCLSPSESGGARNSGAIAVGTRRRAGRSSRSTRPARRPDRPPAPRTALQPRQVRRKATRGGHAQGGARLPPRSRPRSQRRDDFGQSGLAPVGCNARTAIRSPESLLDERRIGRSGRSCSRSPAPAVVGWSVTPRRDSHAIRPRRPRRQSALHHVAGLRRAAGAAGTQDMHRPYSVRS
jgi:hypothetical protein